MQSFNIYDVIVISDTAKKARCKIWQSYQGLNALGIGKASLYNLSEDVRGRLIVTDCKLDKEQSEQVLYLKKSSEIWRKYF